MKRYLMTIMAAALAGAAVLTGSPAGARTLPGVTSAAGGWGKAAEVPGTARLNVNGSADAASVSCASAGNCSAAGYYFGPGNQPFVVSQVDGVWGKAEKVPGIGKLNLFKIAAATSVSCASAGNCSVGGYYQDGNTGSEQEAFVDSQVNGTWGQAEEVPGTAALNTFGGVAAVTSVSCGSAGNCSVGGYYTDNSDLNQAFLDSQVNGVWGNAVEVPGTAALNQGGNAEINSVSCASAGNCSAGGFYADSSGDLQAFVISEVNGVWGNAAEVPVTTAIGAQVSSVSCASAGNCSAGGSYGDNFRHEQAFVVSEVHGTWGNAAEVPGTATLNSGGSAATTSVSCASAGNCSAGGDYTGSAGHHEAFVVSQVHGTWRLAKEVPGTAALNKGNSAFVSTVSCGAVGNCSAGGDYTNSSGDFEVFVVSQARGVWGKAEEVPGSAALNKDHEAGFEGTKVEAVSCASANHCSAGGYYTDSAQHEQAFVVSRT